MSGYVKLFRSILHSTIWQAEDHVRIVWITMLAMADREGLVEGSVPGLAKAAGQSIMATEAALAVLGAPDLHSRTTDHEGRRIAKVDGGWLVLNFESYDQRSSSEESRRNAAQRQARYRARQASVTRDVALGHAESHEVTKSDPLSSSSSSSSEEERESARAGEEAPEPPKRREEKERHGWLRVSKPYKERYEALRAMEFAKHAKHQRSFAEVFDWCASQAKREGADVDGVIVKLLDQLFACAEPFVVEADFSPSLLAGQCGRFYAPPKANGSGGAEAGVDWTPERIAAHNAAILARG